MAYFILPLNSDQISQLIFFYEFCSFIKEKNAIQEELLLRTFAI